MGHVSQNAMLRYPASRVWSMLADLTLVSELHPDIESAQVVNTRPDGTLGVGVERRCDFSDGHHVLERVDVWEPCERLVMVMTGGDLPLKSLTTTVSMRKLHQHATVVTFDMRFEVALGVFGIFMDRWVLRRRFGAMVATVLQRLDEALGQGTGPPRMRFATDGPKVWTMASDL